MSNRPDRRRKIGDYEVLARLKRGGMGQVLLGRRVGAHGFERLVAIKILRADIVDRETFRALLADEARLTALLTHPAITQVYDFGEDGDELYLVMEYVAGVTFREIAPRRPPALVAAQAMTHVCRGLHAAHELADRSGRPLGVVHRDISPQNLVMTFDGGVKILDFGIALTKGRLAPVTEVGSFRGKPAYMSPEQVKNASIDRRTDLFAVGLCLHELLTGKSVFQADRVDDLFRLVAQAKIRPPSEEAGRLPAGLDEVVLCALKRDAQRRFATAMEMARALDAVVSRGGGGQDALDYYARHELEPDRRRQRLAIEKILGGEEPGDDLDGRPQSMATEPRLPQTVGASGKRIRWIYLAMALALLLFGAIAALLHLGADSSSGVVDAGAEPLFAEDSSLPAAARTPVDSPATAQPAVPREMPLPRRDQSSEREEKPESRVQKPVVAPRKAVLRKNQLQPGTVAPLPEEFGFVTVGTNPYALVRIDGEEIGVTPVIRRKLSAGNHEIVLINPQSGKILHRRTVAIEPGRHHEVIVE